MGVLCDFMAYYHLIHERRGLATTSRSNFLTHEHYVCWRIIGFSMVLLNGQLWNIVSTNPEFLHTFTFSPSYLPLPMYLPADGRPTPRFPAISVNVSREYVSLRDAGWMDRTHLKAQREVNWLSSTSPLTIKLLPPSRTYLLMRWRHMAPRALNPPSWSAQTIKCCCRLQTMWSVISTWIWRHGAHDHGAVVVVHEKWEWQGVRAQDCNSPPPMLWCDFCFGACRA